MMQLLPETTRQLSADADLTTTQHVTYDELEAALAEKLAYMISTDFQQFVLLLYKVDVSEFRVRQILESDLSPGVYRNIAALLIERQQEKIVSRKIYSQPPPDDDEEKW
jgi:saccharopine dehydrogenase-like NADP-dependent oxidoreductase